MTSSGSEGKSHHTTARSAVRAGLGTFALCQCVTYFGEQVHFGGSNLFVLVLLEPLFQCGVRLHDDEVDSQCCDEEGNDGSEEGAPTNATPVPAAQSPVMQ